MYLKNGVIFIIILDYITQEYTIPGVNLTSKGKYAVTAVLDLAVHEKNNSTYSKISEVAERQSIPPAYLEQIFRKLRLAGIVKSIRGRNGGYVYASDPSKISIKQVMDAVEEDLDATNCAGASSCFEGSNVLLTSFGMN